jgi:thiamine biosynthesis lipoprotein
MQPEHERAFELFGSRVRLLVGEVAGPRSPELLALEIEITMRQIEKSLSRFDPDSELSRLNRDSSPSVAVSPLLATLIEAIVEAGRRSGGLVDGTVVDALEGAGYARSRAGRNPASLAEALAVAPPRRPARGDPAMPWAALAVDRELGTASRPPGLRIDSGGLGKGLAADLTARRLAECEAFAIDCGGDIRFGGTSSMPRPIELLNPLRPEQEIRFEVPAGAVATSGLRTRIWPHDDGFAHHLIDPSTGEPAWTGVVQATALAWTGVEAETIAKTALLAGPEHGRRLLQAQGGILVLDDGSIECVGALADAEISTAAVAA